jgi:hypothetical protein
VPVIPAAQAPPPPPEPRRGLPTALLVVIGAAMVAAIGLLLLMPGGSENGSTALSPIAQAAEKTASVSGGRFTGTGSGSAAGMTMSLNFNGVFDGTADRSQVDMSAQVSGPQSMTMSLTGIQDGLVYYMSSPLFSGQIPNGAHWMKIDYGALGLSADQGAMAGSVDGSQVLDQLAGVSGETQVVGTETVRGVKATHYTGTLDMSSQIDQLRDQGQDELADQLEAGTATAVDVWIDRKGLVRRTDINMGLSIPGQPALQLAMSVEFYDFGIEPDIVVPAASDTFDATELGATALQG